MAIEPARALILTLALSAFAAASAAESEQPPPDVKRICVPSEDGESWECGTADHPPPERGLPTEPTSDVAPDSAPPPFFLANPDVQVSAVPEQPAAQPAETEPVAEAPAPPRRDEFPEVERPGEVTDESAAASSQAPAEPAQSETVAATEPVAEAPAPEAQAPAPIEPVAQSPEAAPLDPAYAAPSAEPAYVESNTPAAPVASDSAPLGEGPFLQLDARRFTAQLARASDPSQFANHALALGLAPESTYAVPIAAGDQTWWLLLWSDFPDAQAAKTALDALTRQSGLGGAYPRRIGPLQQEVRRVGGAR